MHANRLRSLTCSPTVPSLDRPVARLPAAWISSSRSSSQIQPQSKAATPYGCKATLEKFRSSYFQPGKPIHIKGLYSSSRGAGGEHLPAIASWFNVSATGITTINSTYLAPYASHAVPLELTIHDAHTDGPSFKSFHRLERPLSDFLDYLDATSSTIVNQSPADSGNDRSMPSLYLAQHSLASLPLPLQSDLPTPSLVQHAGKGDVYASSIWLGLAPTSTPLHRDPNPNLLVQIAGRKKVRMLSAELGREVLSLIRREERTTSGNVRGEEMMTGSERRRAEAWLWGHGAESEADVDGGFDLLKHDALHDGEWFEAELQCGDAVFVPLGWWHGFRGVGTGISGSVNWWFR